MSTVSGNQDRKYEPLDEKTVRGNLSLLEYFLGNKALSEETEAFFKAWMKALGQEFYIRPEDFTPAYQSLAFSMAKKLKPQADFETIPDGDPIRFTSERGEIAVTNNKITFEGDNAKTANLFEMAFLASRDEDMMTKGMKLEGTLYERALLQFSLQHINSVRDGDKIKIQNPLMPKDGEHPDVQKAINDFKSYAKLLPKAKPQEQQKPNKPSVSAAAEAAKPSPTPPKPEGTDTPPIDYSEFSTPAYKRKGKAAPILTDVVAASPKDDIEEDKNNYIDIPTFLREQAANPTPTNQPKDSEEESNINFSRSYQSPQGYNNAEMTSHAFTYQAIPSEDVPKKDNIRTENIKPEAEDLVDSINVPNESTKSFTRLEFANAQLEQGIIVLAAPTEEDDDDEIKELPTSTVKAKNKKALYPLATSEEIIVSPTDEQEIESLLSESPEESDILALLNSLEESLNSSKDSNEIEALLLENLGETVPETAFEDITGFNVNTLGTARANVLEKDIPLVTPLIPTENKENYKSGQTVHLPLDEENLLSPFDGTNKAVETPIQNTPKNLVPVENVPKEQLLPSQNSETISFLERLKDGWSNIKTLYTDTITSLKNIMPSKSSNDEYAIIDGPAPQKLLPVLPDAPKASNKNIVSFEKKIGPPTSGNKINKKRLITTTAATAATLAFTAGSMALINNNPIENPIVSNNFTPTPIVEQIDIGSFINDIVDLPTPEQNLNTIHIPSITTPEIAADFVISNLERGGDRLIPEPGGSFSKYGINSEAHPDIDVANITRDDAIRIYKERYWERVGADSVPPHMRLDLFDAAVLPGQGTAMDFYAISGNDLEKFRELRTEYFVNLATRNPEEYGGYLNGWLNRLDKVAAQTRIAAPTLLDETQPGYKTASMIPLAY